MLFRFILLATLMGCTGSGNYVPASSALTAPVASGGPGVAAGVVSGGGAAGCKDSDFVDITAKPLVSTVGTSYSPKCTKIKLGTPVTIQASTLHPMQALPNTLLQPGQAATSDLTQTFTKTGVYGFYCENHGSSDGTGMAGAMVVVP